MDPACGSGTFLFHAIQHIAKHLKNKNIDDEEIVNIIFHTVQGIDLHPVAIALAKATYVMALGDLAQYVDPDQTIPVYLGDSLGRYRIQSGSLFNPTSDAIGIEVPHPPTGDQAKWTLEIPSEIITHPKFGEIVTWLVDEAKSQQITKDFFISRLNEYEIANPDSIDLLWNTFERLQEVHSMEVNHIWAFMIQNLAIPHLLETTKVDRLVGNPPWVNLNKMATQEQKDWLKDELARMNIKPAPRNAPHSNLAMLFVAKCIHLYIEPQNGKFGMVMPHTALNGSNYEKFRAGQWGSMNVQFSTPWDLKSIDPPPFKGHANACVLFGRVDQSEEPNQNLFDQYIQFEGTPPNNLTHSLIKKEEINAPSAYLKNFKQGATITPIPLVMTKEKPFSQRKGEVNFKTAETQGSGPKPWSPRGGSVEEQFSYPISDSPCLVPFYAWVGRWLILPLENKTLYGTSRGDQENDTPLFGRSDQIFFGKHKKLDKYWRSAELEWRKHKTDKAPPTLVANIDYLSKLTKQIDSLEKVRFGYIGSGSNMCGALLPKSTFVSYKLFWTLSTEGEAHYLASIFNSNTLNTRFRTSRETELHFQKHPLKKIPIPKYNADDSTHSQLSSLGKQAHNYVKNYVGNLTSKGQMPGNTKLRKLVREELKKTGISNQIDNQIKKLNDDLVADLKPPLL